MATVRKRTWTSGGQTKVAWQCTFRSTILQKYRNARSANDCRRNGRAGFMLETGA